MKILVFGKHPVPMPTEELEDNQYYAWNESIVNWEIQTKQ
jgi:hypothetical protein